MKIKTHIAKNHKEHTIKDTGVLDYYDKFQYPFDLLFNMDMKIIKTPDGRYLSENETGDLEFNPGEIITSI